MCNLDLIATGDPVQYTQDELWLQWFFKNIQEADFTVMLTIFGAVFLLTLSIIALFAVMLLKNRFPKNVKTVHEGDGSVHFVPLLLCVAATAMFVIGALILLGFMLMQFPHYGLYHWLTMPYGSVLLYIGIMAILFEIVLRFSPNGSKWFLGWNRICRNVCLAILIPGLLVIAFFYCFYWFCLLV
jgi:hypothetical protein